LKGTKIRVAKEVRSHYFAHKFHRGQQPYAIILQCPSKQQEQTNTSSFQMLHHKLYSFRKTGLAKNATFYCSSDCTYAEAEQQLAALTCKTKHNQN